MAKIFNTVSRFEIHAGNPERAIAFYSYVFGWEIKKWEERGLDYWLISTSPEGTPGAINGGLVRGQFDNSADNCLVSGFVCIIYVEDIDVTIKKILDSGGSIALQKFELKSRGYLAYLKDTEGNVFAVLQELSYT
jgi:predicted enzyme related to lactoylglutathione lyase